MAALKDLTGQRFGMLLVTGRFGQESDPSKWSAACDCGKTKVFRADCLRHGDTKSCGCLSARLASERTVKHGHTMGGQVSPTFRVWTGIQTRCTNPNDPGYASYGARGIEVCERWRSFENFLADMGERPTGKQIDRIDNEKGYSPDNCRWVTPKENSRNKRSHKLLAYQGRELTAPEWGEIMGISPFTIWERLKSGWSEEKAVGTPARSYKKRV